MMRHTKTLVLSVRLRLNMLLGMVRRKLVEKTMLLNARLRLKTLLGMVRRNLVERQTMTRMMSMR